MPLKTLDKQYYIMYSINQITVMKKVPDKFTQYLQALTEEDAVKISDFFAGFDKRVSISRGEKNKMRADFENALLYYSGAGVLLDDALAGLSVENLGGFYIRPPILWYALDDAAQIFPLSMKHGKMEVFRLSVYFKTAVVPELLQIALTFTIKRFPTFATTVKKGFFWHYLDTAKRRYSVSEESDIPCKPIKISGSSSQSFRVLYFGKRVSIECFHILTDGTGGLFFLKTLTAEYLRLLYAEKCTGEGVLDINAPPETKETSNDFALAEKTENAPSLINKPAVQMSGKISRIKPCRILHFRMDAARLKEVAQSKNATITAYVLALMFVAVKHATDEAAGNINIQVPVNMRKFYNSETLRNFFLFCGINLPISRITGVDSVISEISSQLNQKASKQSMEEMLSATRSMLNKIRYIPLFIKAPVARNTYEFFGDRVFTCTFSNVGVVKAPPQLEKYIENIDCMMGGTLTKNRAKCAMVTFGKTATFSIVKMTADSAFEEKMLELFAADGIAVKAEGSELYEG